MMSITLPTRGPIEDLDWLRSFAARLAHHEADDLVQDTMLGAISHATEQPRSRPWLATVMRNRFRMEWRSASRRKARESAFHAGRDETVTPDIATHRLRVLRVLVERLEALPAEDRQIVIARHLDGHDATEIGRALGLPAATVRSRLRRSLQRLRRDLDEHFRGERVTWAAAVSFPPSGAAAGAGASVLLLSAKQIVGAVLAVFAVATLAWLGLRSNGDLPPTTDAAAPEHEDDEGVRTRAATAAVVESARARSVWLRRRTQIEAAHRRIGVLDTEDGGVAAKRPEGSADVQSLVDEAHGAQSQAVLDCDEVHGGPLVGALILRTRVLGAPDIGTIFETIDVVGESESSPELVECIQAGMYAFVGTPPVEPFELTTTVTHLGPRPSEQDEEAWRRRIVEAVVTAHLAEVRACENQADPTGQPPVGRISLTLSFEEDPYPSDVQVRASAVPESIADCVARAAWGWRFPRPMLADRSFTHDFVLPIDAIVDGTAEGAPPGGH